MHAISSYRGNRLTNKQTLRPPQTGPTTINCAAKLSAQCNKENTALYKQVHVRRSTRPTELALHFFKRLRPVSDGLFVLFTSLGLLTAVFLCLRRVIFIYSCLCTINNTKKVIGVLSHVFVYILCVTSFHNQINRNQENL